MTQTQPPTPPVRGDRWAGLGALVPAGETSAGWQALIAAIVLGPVGTVLGVRVLRAAPAGDPNRRLAVTAILVGVVHTLAVLAVIALGVWLAVWAAAWAVQ